MMTLPTIHVRYARLPTWVVNSDFRRADGPQNVRQTYSFPAPTQNGHLVTSENAGPERMTHYTNDAYGSRLRAENSPARRQQSLPSRRLNDHERVRPAKSAPSRKDQNGGNNDGGAPLPKINSLMARSRDPTAGGGDQNHNAHVITTAFAGISTKNQDSSHIRSNKFASSWAQVRAENHIDVGTSSEHTKQSPRNSSQEAVRSHERTRDQSESPRRNKSTSPHRSQPDASRESRARGNNRGVFHAKTQDKENQPPNNSTAKKNQTSPQAESPSKNSKDERREKHDIRFTVPDEGRDTESASPATGDTDITSIHDNNNGHHDQEQKARKTSDRKPSWDNRLTIKPPDLDLKVKSQRRYEAELTHKPAVTSTDQVYKAYTGLPKHQALSEGGRHTSPESQRGRPPTKDSYTTDDSRQSDATSRHNKDYILTRKEAKMYIHLQGVYGSDAFRHQRKEYFFKKLTNLQQKEDKQQAEDRRKAQQRREESKRRQQRQLMYVRRKFLRQQLHRFRTQYVTSRVLEYEREDRDLYGLPGDSEDSDDDSGYFPEKSDSSKTTSSNDNKDGAPNNARIDGAKVDRDGSRKDTSTGDTKNSKPSHVAQPDVKHSTVSDARQESNNVHSNKVRKDTVKQSNISRAAESTASTAPVAKSTKDTTKITESSKPEAVDSKESENNNVQNISHKDTKKSENVKDKQNTTDTSTDVRGKQNTVTKEHRADADKEKNKAKTDNEKVKNETKTKDSLTNGGDKDVSKDGATVKGKTTNKDNVSKPSTNNTSDNVKDTTQQKPPTTTQISTTTTQNPAASTTKNSGDSNKPLADGPSDAPVSQGKGTVSAKATAGNKRDDKPDADSKAVIKPENRSKEKEEAKKGVSTGNNAGAQQDTGGKVYGHSFVHAAPASSTKGEDTKGSVAAPQPAGVSKKESEKEQETDTATPGKVTTMRKDSKGRYITTTRVFGSDTPAHAKASTHSNAKTDYHRQSSQDRHMTDKASARPSQNRSQSESRGRKRKPAHAHPLTEADQKKQLERKYGKMFDVSLGPARKSGSKPPKMEGIDTVLLKETDNKGRTRTKKRDVKDVVKEAKMAVAAPTDPDSPGRSKVKAGQSSQPGADRPPSADTLDFDDDDDDDDDDVFERLRKKYNLQIDSDDD